MTDTTNSGVNGLQAAKVVFQGENLVFPPIPEPFRDTLKTIRDNIWGANASQSDLYPVEVFVSGLGSGTQDYLLMGFDGHGTSSWALHYYLVTDRLALFIQKGWGNAFDDDEIARGRIKGTFGFVVRLLQELEQAEKEGNLPAGQRLAIVDSDFGNSRWAWVPQSSFQEDKVTWNESTLSLVKAFTDIKTRRGPAASG